MSESSLAMYRVLNTKNINYRGNKTIKYVLPHAYCRQVTAKEGVDAFNRRGDASVHYIAGKDAFDIGQQVSENYRAWCTGGDKTLVTPYGRFTGREIDFEAVTIETACDNGSPNAITVGAFQNLVNLMADIAIRNNMGLLKFKGDPQLVGNPAEQNVLCHRWFASKSCPGPDIYAKLPEIVRLSNEVINTGKWYVAPVPKLEAAKPTLRKGNRGAQVKLLQQDLMAIGIKLPRYGADGDFGDETRSGVIAFQKMAFPNSPIEWDGIYGPKSYTAMINIIAKL